MIIKCVVACYNANGEADLFPVLVAGDESAIECGRHYDSAKDEAEDRGYSATMCFDESAPGGKLLIPLFTWNDEIPYVEIPSF